MLSQLIHFDQGVELHLQIEFTILYFNYMWEIELVSFLIGIYGATGLLTAWKIYEERSLASFFIFVASFAGMSLLGILSFVYQGRDDAEILFALFLFSIFYTLAWSSTSMFMLRFRLHRLHLPPVSRTKTPTQNTIKVRRSLDKEHMFGAHQILYDDRFPNPEVVTATTDGHRLFIRFTDIHSIKFWRILLINMSALFLFISAILSLNVEDPTDFLVYISGFIMLCCFSIYFSFLEANENLKHFIVFDRDNGNVLFSRVGRLPELAVAFEDVACFTDHLVTKSSMQFIAKIECLRKTEKMRRRHVHILDPVWIQNYVEAKRFWAFINRFMDNSKDVLDLDLSPGIRRTVHWFRERKITFEDVMCRYGYVEVLPDGKDEIKWEDRHESNVGKPKAVNCERP